jgi:hypothetical protein
MVPLFPVIQTVALPDVTPATVVGDVLTCVTALIASFVHDPDCFTTTLTPKLF